MSLSRHSSGACLGWTIRALWAIAALTGSTAFAQVRFADDLFGVRIDARQRTTLWGYTQIQNPAATAADRSTWFFSGLFRSTDNGAAWTSLRVPWQRARIRQVELDPLASGVAYVLLWAGRQYLWRTQDGGANWTALTTGLPENAAALTSLYVHGNPAAVYLQHGNMLYKSADGGQSFRPLGAHGCASRVEHTRTDPRRLYCGSVNGDILSSTDEGLTWTPGGRIPTGRPGVLISNDGIQVLSDPARPGLLLISVWGVTNSGNGDSLFDAVYRSPDGGRTFAALNPMPSLHTLQASPDRRLVFVTGSGANGIRSRNFGDSWEQLPSSAGQLGDLGFDPLDANILWSDGRRRSTDGGTTFTNVTRELLASPAAGPAPVLPANGVVSLAAGAPVVAPGAIFALYGTQLSRNTSEAAGAPLPVSLGGVQVEVNSRNVPLFFVSPGQINAQMPFDAGEGVARVRVIRDGVSSGEATVRVALGAPDILVYDGAQAVAVDESNKLIGAANPVVAGRVMVVYLTGIGPVSPALATGAATPGDALRRASLPFSATLSGQPAEVAFLGLTPSFVGLAQANITVPPDTPAGPQPLVLTVGGAESNRVNVQVVQP